MTTSAITLAHFTAEPHVGLSSLLALVGMGLAAGFAAGTLLERLQQRRAARQPER